VGQRYRSAGDAALGTSHLFPRPLSITSPSTVLHCATLPSTQSSAQFFSLLICDQTTIALESFKADLFPFLQLNSRTKTESARRKNMRPEYQQLTDLYRSGKISRRDFIRAAVLLGLSVSNISLLLAACTSENASTATPVPPEEVAATAAPVQPTATPLPPTATAVPEPKILKLRMVSDLVTADPAFHPAGADTITAETVGEGLVTFKPGTWDVVNVLAESIEQSEDGLRIDFRLKEGVQFHKGYGELTADDVKFSYERFIDPELDASYKGDWEALDHVDVTGKYTGTIVLKESFAPLWVSTLPVTAGIILSKKAVDEIGNENYGINPVGTGPYEFAEWTPNQKWILKRFADYRGETPEWDEIHLMPITEDSAAEIALETGEVQGGFVAADAVERFEANDDFQVLSFTSVNYDGILLNVQHPKLQDINVRQAIRYGVDADAIVEAAYLGKATRACAALAPTVLGYWKDAPCYERDVEKAKDYLAKAGLDSLDVTLTVINTELDRTVAEIVQANLADVGINVEIIAQDEGTYWDAGFGEEGIKNRQLTYIRWSSTNPDPFWITVWFPCEQVGQWNWMEWCSEDFDRLHYGAMAELDPEKREEMYIELQKVWDEAATAVWVAHPNNYYVVSTDLVAVTTPLGLIIPKDFRSKS
jgi:peptide/nickel transport system substrate-binding protein